jgi:hypothetical protein
LLKNEALLVEDACWRRAAAVFRAPAASCVVCASLRAGEKARGSAPPRRLLTLPTLLKRHWRRWR